MANNRDRYHGDTASRRGVVQFSATRILSDLGEQTTPDSNVDSTPPEAEEASALHYWLGRKVLHSQLLTANLIEMCGLPNVLATDGEMLALPLTKRHAFTHMTREELEERNAAVVARMPQATDDLTIQVTGMPSYGKSNNATLAASLDVRSEGFDNFSKMCEAIQRILRPDPGRKSVPHTLRIVEGARRSDIHTARGRVGRSGLFIGQVRLGPVEVCSSPVES